MRNESAASTAHESSRAFYRDPRVVYVLPDEAGRRDVLPLFLRSVLIPAAQTCGEIYTTAKVDGCSLWISPGLFSAWVGMVRTKMPALQLKLAPSSLMRWATLIATMEEVHRRLAKDAHWYLLALGIQPSRPDDVSGVLVDPVLSRADRDQHTCYVENFDEASLSFYENRGFRIVGAGRVPRGGPNFWAMIRRPALGKLPSSAEEGWTRHKTKPRSDLIGADGVVLIKKSWPAPPRLREMWWLRNFFLIARRLLLPRALTPP
jgi:hypothetical protein